MPHFPFRLDRFYVFIWWKGGHGPIRTYIELIHARTGALIRRTDVVVIDFVSRTDSAYGGYEFDACEMPEPGYYWVEAYCEGVFVDDQAIEVSVR